MRIPKNMLEKMPELVIPVINEVFKTSYDVSEKMEQLRNEHHTKHGEIITDSCISIRDCLYHIECQSRPDGQMVIRMMEYDFSVAIENAELGGHDMYEMSFPQSCVLYLRHDASTPDKLKMKVHLRTGESFVYETAIIKVQNYTSDEIFQKELLFFLPFYIMRYEKDLKKISRNSEEANRFFKDFTHIREALEKELTDNGKSDLYTSLIALIKRISDYMLKDEQILKKGVAATMGGKVLMLESERLEKKGRREGKIEGKREGKLEGAAEKGMQIYLNMRRRGIAASEAKALADISDTLADKAEKMI